MKVYKMTNNVSDSEISKLIKKYNLKGYVDNNYKDNKSNDKSSVVYSVQI